MTNCKELSLVCILPVSSQNRSGCGSCRRSRQDRYSSILHSKIYPPRSTSYCRSCFMRSPSSGRKVLTTASTIGYRKGSNSLCLLILSNISAAVSHLSSTLSKKSWHSVPSRVLGYESLTRLLRCRTVKESQLDSRSSIDIRSFKKLALIIERLLSSINVSSAPVQQLINRKSQIRSSY